MTDLVWLTLLDGQEVLAMVGESDLTLPVPVRVVRIRITFVQRDHESDCRRDDMFGIIAASALLVVTARRTLPSVSEG